MIKKILLLILMLAFSQISNAEDNSIAVIVNDIPITNLDIEKRVNLIFKTSSMSKDAESKKLLREHVKSLLIDEVLIANAAAEKRIGVDAVDMAQAMNSIAERNGLKPNELDIFLKERGINRSDFEAQIAGQIILNKYLRMVIQPRISVSNIEVEESRKSIINAVQKANRDVSKMKIAEIVLYPTNNNDDSIVKLANKITKDLGSGADFKKLAKEFSNSNSAASGGEIGWIYLNQIMPDIANAIADLKQGEVSRPIILNDGIHIIKVLDVKLKDSSSAPQEIDDVQIKNIILNKKLDLQVKGFLRKLRRDAYIDFK